VVSAAGVQAALAAVQVAVELAAAVTEELAAPAETAAPAEKAASAPAAWAAAVSQHLTASPNRFDLRC